MKKIIEGLTFESLVCKLSTFMSLKLLKLRWRIFFWTITGRIKKMHSRLQLTLSQGNPENILIIFPMDEPSFRVACYAFRDLGKENVHKRQFIFIVKEQFKDLFHLRIGSSIFINYTDQENILSGEKNILHTVYSKGFSGTEDISLNQISEFIFAINNDLETTISSSKNANGLYHAYNTIQIDLKKQSMDVQHLDLMLEGQVAALSSGLLKTDDAIEVLDTLSVSELYRESMRSFMLYPIKKVIPYLEKNIIQPHSIAKSKLLSTMLQNKDFTLIEQDADDQFRFKPQFRNSFDLQAALHQILDKKDYKDLVDQENDLVLLEILGSLEILGVL